MKKIVSQIALTIFLILLLPVIHAGALTVVADAASIGNFGLRATAGPQCVMDDINETGPVVTTDLKACNTITTTGEVDVTGDATFIAGNSIAFGPGFKVVNGVTFIAETDPFVGSDFAGVTDESPDSGDSFFARFDFNLDNLTLTEDERIAVFSAFSSDGNIIFQFGVRRNGGVNRLNVLGRQANGITFTNEGDIINPGFNSIEFDLQTGDPSPPPGDNTLTYELKGGLKIADSNFSDINVDRVEIGLLEWLVSSQTNSPITSTGSIDIDEYASFR